VQLESFSTLNDTAQKQAAKSCTLYGVIDTVIRVGTLFYRLSWWTALCESRWGRRLENCRQVMLYTRTYIWVNVPHECLHFDPHQSPRVLTYTYSARAAHNFRGVANLGRGAVRPPRPRHLRISQPKNYRTTRRQTNSWSVNSRTGQLADSEFLNIMELLYFICALNLTLTIGLTVTLSNIGSV